MTIIPLFSHHQPEITPKAGHTLLECMQEARGLPYYAPTVQFRAIHPRSDLYLPINPLADLFAKLIGRQVLTESQLVVIKSMGMAVERGRA